MIFIIEESDLCLNDKCILYFYTTWIPFNKKMMLILNKFEQKCKDLKFYAINADDFKPLIKRFNIDRVPTVIFFDQKEQKRIKGLTLTSAFKSFFTDI